MTRGLARRRLPSRADAPWAFPPPWAREWQRQWLHGDLTAGVVVAIMLVPQSLAYALLAGLPAQVGLMASLLPLIAYAAFGSSASLSVGPAAITSLMVAQSLTPLASPGTGPYAAMAAVLALGSGLLMLVLGCLRMGFLSQLLSRPVVQGFTMASALLIIAGQLAPLLGARSMGHTLPDMWRAMSQGQQAWDMGNASIGLCSMVLLVLGPRVLASLGGRVRWSQARTQVLMRLWPLAVLVAMAVLANWLGEHANWRVTQVGAVSVQLDGAMRALAASPSLAASTLTDLAMPILLISLVGFVSSMSVAQTFALKQGERIDADRELLGLAAANLGAAVLGGMPVAGGLSRSVVNESAGARSPLAGVISAVVLAALLLAFLPWLAYLPKAALAAVIITAVLGLVQFSPLVQAWRYDRADAWAFISTALGVLMLGFESGILLGIAWSLGAMVWRHSQPHMAEVGRLPGTEHFRNVNRFQVDVLPGVLMVRVDESLDFTNIQRVELGLCEMVHSRQDIRQIVLLLSAVNHIDHSAMQTLLELDQALADQGRTLYLAEVKGFVMDRLQACGAQKRFDGRIHLSAQHAWDALV